MNIAAALASVGALPWLIALTAGCSGSATAPAGSPPATGSSSVVNTPAASPPLTTSAPYAPTIDPAAFSTTIDNPFFPLVPGTRIIYQASTRDGMQRTTTEVTRDTKTVMGVATVVVHDTVSLDGRTTEDTYDWYAQHRDGSVWYFGEATTDFTNGTADTAGSFEAGVGGALPGIVMPAHPSVGDHYRQEYAKGVAEDTGSVVSLTGADSTPLTGPVKDLLVTQDADGLDPAAPAENKYYVRGIGLILTTEAGGRDEAVTVEKF